MERLLTATFDSPVGPLMLVASDRGLRAVLWPTEKDGRVRLPETAPDESAPEAAARLVLRRAMAQLDEYFAGTRREFDVPLDPHGTDFQQQAWNQLRLIPYGTTITYGEQAARMGDRNKSRAVGAANGRNPISIIVPCHRVIGASGALVGFAAGVGTKAWLLDHERAVLARS